MDVRKGPRIRRRIGESIARQLLAFRDKLDVAVLSLKQRAERLRDLRIAFEIARAERTHGKDRETEGRSRRGGDAE
jgi:hypothetical protein